MINNKYKDFIYLFN